MFTCHCHILKEEAGRNFCQKLLFVNIITYHCMFMCRCYISLHVCTVVFRGNLPHVFVLVLSCHHALRKKKPLSIVAVSADVVHCFGFSFDVKCCNSLVNR